MTVSASNRWSQLPSAFRWLVSASAAYAILVLRRPETLLHAQFLSEDGPVFFLGSYFGNPLESALRPYNGFLHLVPRLVSLLERQVPVASAPVVSNAVALAIAACLAAFVASDRLSEVMPDRRLRCAVAAFLLVLPASHESLGSITYSQFYLGLYLFAASAATMPTGRGQTVRDYGSLIAASLTGPFGVLLAPLYWARAWCGRDPASVLRAAVVTVPAAIQVLVFAAWAVGPGHPAQTDLHPTMQVVIQVVGLRLVDVPIIGVVWSLLVTSADVPLLVGVVGTMVLGSMLLATTVALPRTWRVRLLYVWGAIGLFALVREGQLIPSLLNPGIGERYLLIPTAVVGVTVVTGFTAAHGRVRLPAAVLAALLVFGVVGDFRLPPWPNVDWQHRSACIGGPAPCAVPVSEGWTIDWPGQAGVYQQPGP